MITKENLKHIMPYANAMALNQFCEPLNATLLKYDMLSPLRAAAFLAQIAHESGQLKYTQEIASGKAYEGRKDLGNTQPGDGVKFKGRGLIQITGRANYAAISKDLGVNFIDKPELLEGPLYAAESAGWFWKLKGLNALADIPNFEVITRRINGGLNGYAERLEYYKKAKEVVGIN